MKELWLKGYEGERTRRERHAVYKYHDALVGEKIAHIQARENQFLFLLTFIPAESGVHPSSKVQKFKREESGARPSLPKKATRSWWFSVLKDSSKGEHPIPSHPTVLFCCFLRLFFLFFDEGWGAATVAASVISGALRSRTLLTWRGDAFAERNGRDGAVDGIFVEDNHARRFATALFLWLKSGWSSKSRKV